MQPLNFGKTFHSRLFVMRIISVKGRHNPVSVCEGVWGKNGELYTFSAPFHFLNSIPIPLGFKCNCFI